MLLAMARENQDPDEEWTWYGEILKHYPSGVDLTQLEERLKLTPTERLEKMRQFLIFLEEAKRPRGD
jgi:hypothetical protein